MPQNELDREKNICPKIDIGNWKIYYKISVSNRLYLTQLNLEQIGWLGTMAFALSALSFNVATPPFGA